MTTSFAGRRFLVLEDEYLVARDLAGTIERLGGEVVGPANGLAAARRLFAADGLDGAVLDIKLDGDTSFGFADELCAAGVPIVFASGYADTLVPGRFAGVARLAKPIEERALRQALEGLLTTRDARTR